MASDKLKMISKGLAWIIPYLFTLLGQRIHATWHRITWRDTPDAQNVVVIGGSFAGIQLVKRLTETLPSGSKVVWIEKNSHLNFSFNFPRFSVMTGHEHKAFIPYDGVTKSAPSGILTRIQDTVVGVTNDRVLLASGEKVEYSYLALATGSTQPLPVQVSATERSEACHELQGVQGAIKDSRKIAVVGGGAVGVELSSDIKDFYPEKEVTLIQSRGELLSRFGKRLQDYALNALRDELKVRVLLNERPKMPMEGNIARSAMLTFSDGREETFDLIIGCTGQRPNSSILESLLPNAISEQTSRILVRPSLQVAPSDAPHIFALGDVAEHGGPLMARTGLAQAEVVLDNILTLMKGQTPSRTYKPNLFIEGSIKLTLGKTHQVIYARDADGSDAMIPSHGGTLDLDIKRVWGMYGADFKLADAAKIEREGTEGLLNEQ